MRRFLPVLLLTGCLSSEPSPEGDYAHAAFHLLVECPDGSRRIVDYLYPSSAGFELRDLEGEALSLTWGSRQLATGKRDASGAIDLDFSRRDPFTAPADWTFHGRLRTDFRFLERVVVGNVTSGEAETGGMTCSIHPRSVAWFATAPRNLDARDLDPSGRARADGPWSRFVWFLDAGPYAMTRKGDPGQRGENLRLFSFAATGGGRITAGSQGAFFENGFGQWLGAAEGSSAVFPQHESQWELDFAQDVIWDDGKDGVGIRRVLAGWVTGTYRVNATDYPSGWEGETGLLPLVTPGVSYWLDFERGEVTSETVVRSEDLEWTP